MSASRRGIHRIKLPERLYDCSPAPLNKQAMPVEVVALQSCLLRYLNSLHPLEPLESGLHLVFEGTDFQKRVWREIARIEYGSTLSYRAIAERIGNPKAARAVGSACGKNPFPMIIPCHRVVAHSGLGGFTGDVAIKKRLLELEKKRAAEGMS